MREQIRIVIKSQVQKDKKLFILFIISACALVPLLYLSVGYTLKFPMPSFLSPSKGNAKWFALCQAAFSVIVIGANYEFFTRGFVALIRRAPDTNTLISLCSGVAFVYSLVLTVLTFTDINFHADAAGLHFVSAAAILAIAAFCKWLEEKSKKASGGGRERVMRPEQIAITADRIAVICVPATCALALLTFAVWLLIDGAFVPEHCITYAISIFVAACPCALGAVTSMASTIAMRRGASFGVQYKDVENLQKTAELNCVLLDKTAIDSVNEGGKQAIAMLKERKIRVAMLTADSESTAKAVAQSLGIDDFVAEASPEDKLRAVENMQSIGGNVAMVEDGISNSPAFKQADVGIAIGKVADEIADGVGAVLVGGDLRALDTAIDLSRATVRNIRQNLFLAFFFNALMIPVAAGALSAVGFAFNCMIALSCMIVSLVFVLCNSLRLLRYKTKYGKAAAPRENN